MGKKINTSKIMADARRRQFLKFVKEDSTSNANHEIKQEKK